MVRAMLSFFKESLDHTGQQLLKLLPVFIGTSPTPDRLRPIVSCNKWVFCRYLAINTEEENGFCW